VIMEYAVNILQLSVKIRLYTTQDARSLIQLKSDGGFLGNCDGELVTSLYGDSSLNPSVISSVKSPAKTATSSNLFF